MQTSFVIVIAIVAVLGTLLWMGVHLIGVIFYAKRPADGPKPTTLALAAWITSFVSGFLGPLAILGNMVAFVMGVIAWRGAKDNPGNLIPARTATVAGLLLTLMGCSLIVVTLAVIGLKG